MTRTNVLRYARWQIQDFMMDRGVALVLIGVLLASPEIIVMHRIKGPSGIDANQMVLRMATAIAVIFALVSLNGQVSSDRTKGYFRFMFAKPVSPAAYYAQQFVVWFVGLMVVTAVLLGLFALAVGPISPWPVLGYVALVYASMGGIGFFISTVLRRDWLVLIGFWTMSGIMMSLYRNRESWVEQLFFILPPVEHLDNAGKALITHTAPAFSDIAWLLIYSAVFFALGIFVLHRRPFHS